jgi:hypothetical protein
VWSFRLDNRYVIVGIICKKPSMTHAVFWRFHKIAKIYNLLLHVCPSVFPHGRTRITLHGFSLNLIFENFSKICRENSSFVKNRTKITDTLHEDQYTFFIISRSFLLRMRNVSERSCRENQNTFCDRYTFFSSKIVPCMR